MDEIHCTMASKRCRFDVWPLTVLFKSLTSTPEWAVPILPIVARAGQHVALVSNAFETSGDELNFRAQILISVCGSH